MRITSLALTAAVASGAVALLAACSGGGAPGSSSALPAGNGMQSTVHSMVRQDGSGRAPSLAYRGPQMPGPIEPDVASGITDLAVTDSGTGAIEILNKSYVLKTTITNGANGPDGDWYDTKGNLYVANYNGIDVQEYKKGGTSPSFTYNAGVGDPIGVTTDAKGNVYVADYNFGTGGFVVEYKQHSNTVLHSCAPGLGGAEGVAVDKKGNVFVYLNASASGSGEFEEYKGGLSGCSGTLLTPGSIGFAGGMVMDTKGDLVACDQNGGGTGLLDIIKPPYTSIASTIPASLPFHDALNKKNKLVFAASLNNANVQVYTYPGGSSVTTLGSGNGLSDPVGVAAF